MDSTEIFDFGLRLKRLRKAKKLSQAGLAKKLGVSKGSIYRYESNTQMPSLETAGQMAQILGTSLDYLAGLDNQPVLRLPPLNKEEQQALQEFLRVFVKA